MFLSNFFVCLFVCWTLVTLALYLLQSLLFSRCRSNEIVIKPLYVRIFSEKLASVINKHFSRNRRFSQLWFSVGTVITLLMIPASTLLLLFASLSSFRSIESTRSEVLEAVIPGVNLPKHELCYYFSALLISSVVHELGHAIAAVTDSVKLYGFGFYVFVIVPAAFVELSTEQMMSKCAWSRLRIVSAGVWHNIALTFVAAILLVANNFLLSPFYLVKEGAVVAFVNPASGVAGHTGLIEGDIIDSIDKHCKVFDKSSWTLCLKQVSQGLQKGYCVPNHFIDNEQFLPLNDNICCDEDSKSNLCFRQISSDLRKCLPVRQLLQISTMRCGENFACESDHFCVTPLSNNSFKLIEIERQMKNSVLFWGDTDELFSSLILINYKPKFAFLPLLFLHHYECLLRYICSFSMALAVLNAVPCVWLDGKWILDNAIVLFFNKRVSLSTRNYISFSLTYFGTALVFVTAATGMYNVFKIKSIN